jgi:hypothetical protein
MNPLTLPEPTDFEQIMSTLSFSTASLERLDTLTPEHLVRLQQTLIRLSNTERRFTRESEK